MLRMPVGQGFGRLREDEIGMLNHWDWILRKLNCPSIITLGAMLCWVLQRCFLCGLDGTCSFQEGIFIYESGMILVIVLLGANGLTDLVLFFCWPLYGLTCCMPEGHCSVNFAEYRWLTTYFRMQVSKRVYIDGTDSWENKSRSSNFLVTQERDHDRAIYSSMKSIRLYLVIKLP